MIDQDYYRHVLLDGQPDEKNIVPVMVGQNTRTALHAGYHVIVEGIFRKEKYLAMFESLIGEFADVAHIHYFDVSFDETVRLHTTRSKAAQFTAAHMKEWYAMAEPLGVKYEYVIPESMTELDIVALIQKQAGL